MDRNKLEALREAGYRIPVTCGLCRHGVFPPGGRWGECARIRYQHRKHANPAEGRMASVFVGGTCPGAEADPGRTGPLEGHAAFLG